MGATLGHLPDIPACCLSESSGCRVGSTITLREGSFYPTQKTWESTECQPQLSEASLMGTVGEARARYCEEQDLLSSRNSRAK